MEPKTHMWSQKLRVSTWFLSSRASCFHGKWMVAFHHISCFHSPIINPDLDSTLPLHPMHSTLPCCSQTSPRYLALEDFGDVHRTGWISLIQGLQSHSCIKTSLIRGLVPTTSLHPLLEVACLPRLPWKAVGDHCLASHLDALDLKLLAAG